MKATLVSLSCSVDFKENTRSLDILIIGHISLDKRDDKLLKGGPPQYQIPILLSYEVNSVDILTSCNDETLFSSNDKLHIINVPSQKTTTYGFTQPSDQTEGDDRVLTLLDKATVLNHDHLDLLGKKEYQIIIISGIAGEINLELIGKIRVRFPKSYLVVDAQTLTRTISDNNVAITEPMNLEQIFNLSGILKNGVLKGSKTELPNLSEIKEMYDKDSSNECTIIRTNSGDDIEVIFNKDQLNIPVDNVSEDLIIDSTGSGDIFLVSYAIQSFNLIDQKSHLSDKAVKIAHEITKHHLFIEGIPSIIKSDIILEYVHSDTIIYKTNPLVLRCYYDVYAENDFYHAKKVFDHIDYEKYPQLYIQASFAIANFHGWFAEGREALKIRDNLEKLKNQTSERTIQLFVDFMILSIQWFHFTGYNDWSHESDKAKEIALKIQKFVTSDEIDELLRREGITSLPLYLFTIFREGWKSAFIDKEIADLEFYQELVINKLTKILPIKFGLQLQFYGGWESIGRYHSNRGNFQKAEEYYSKSPPYFSPWIKFASDQNLANLAYKQGNVKRAIQVCKELSELGLEHGLYWAVVHNLINLSNYQLELQNFSGAVDTLEQAMKLSIKLENKVLQSTVLFQLGNIEVQKYQKTGNRETLIKAKDHLNKIEVISQIHDDIRIRHRKRLLNAYINQYGTLIERAKALETYYDLEQKLTNRKMDLEISLRILEMNINDVILSEDPKILDEISTRLEKIQSGLNFQEGNYPFWCKIQIILAQYYSTIFQEYEKAIDILERADETLREFELSFLSSIVQKELRELKNRISSYLKSSLSVKDRIIQHNVQSYIKKAKYILYDDTE